MNLFDHFGLLGRWATVAASPVRKLSTSNNRLALALTLVLIPLWSLPALLVLLTLGIWLVVFQAAWHSMVANFRVMTR